MKHHIIVKFKNEVVFDENLYKEIESVFLPLTSMDGIHKVELIRNCIKRDNRYDLMIIIYMDKEILPIYDASESHHYWKEKYGSLIEKKAIFDSEEVE